MANNYSEKITRAVKAELARRGLTPTALVEPLGLNRNAVYARFRFEQPFDTKQLETIADFLGIGLEVIFQSAALDQEQAGRAEAA